MKSTSNMIALSAIAAREIRRFVRIWTQALLPSVITISLYFVIFGRLVGPRIGEMGGVSYIQYITPGLIMMSVITNSYSNVATSFFSAKFMHCIEEMLVAPIPNYLLVFGYVIGGVSRGILVGALVTTVALFFSHIHVAHAWMAVAIMLLSSIFFSLAGLLNGLFAKNFDDVAFIPSFVLTPLIYLGGVFYSIHVLPDVWRNVSLFNPILYLVNAFRFGFLGVSDVNVVVSIGMIGVFILLIFGVILVLMHKGVGIRS